MKKIIVFIILLGLVGSCVSFKEVHSFSTSSEKRIDQYKDIAYTFSGNCNYKCTQRALENPVFQTSVKNCSCEEAVLADKNMDRLLKVLSAYFKAMCSLSEKEKTTYSFNSIQKPLVEGKFIKKEVLKPYANLAKLISGLLTDKYRSIKLKQLIDKANSDVVLLLETLTTIIENNLLPTLTTRSTELQQMYHDMYADPSNASVDKFNIQKMYFSELTSIATKKEALKKYGKSLAKIRKGHHDLYNNRNKLKEKDVKKRIANYANELNDILEQF